MNGDAHNLIMEAAVAALPAAMQEVLAPVQALIGIVGNYPDIFDNPTRTDEERDQDDPEWRRFTRFPPEIGGTMVNFWPHPVSAQDRHIPLVTYLLDRALEAFRRNEPADGIKFVGCLSHHLGDICQPIHTVDEELIAELMPVPASMPNFHYHADIEAVTGACGELRPPRILGLSIDESAWRQAGENLQSIVDCRAVVVPTLQALFAGDQVEAERLAEMPMTRAAQGTADLLYTVLTLAQRGSVGITDDERQSLAIVDLRLRRRDGEHQSGTYGGAILDGSRATPPAGAPIHPATLRFAGDVVRPVRGLGVLPTSQVPGSSGTWMRYALPPGVFDRFEALAGMDAVLTDDGAADFVIELDGQSVWSSGRRTALDEALPVNVTLDGSSELILRVGDANAGRTYFDNHAIWGEPRLIKGEQ